MPAPALFPRPRKWEISDSFHSHKLPDDPEIFLSCCKSDSSLNPEGYRIVLTENDLNVILGSPAAFRFAWQHFQQWSQLVPCPCGTLEDAPALKRRGFMLDISRCKVPTRESLAEWVQVLSALRYNEFQLYTEHSFAYKGHEAVWQEASPLTPDDIRWLQQVCMEEGIDLVPNQNCFGHFERWIKHAAYRKFAESPDGFITPWGTQRKVGSVLKPDENSLSLIQDLLDQLLPLFHSAWVNIGCDETFELGQGASKARCEAEGRESVYAGFVRQVMDHVLNTHGKKPQFWGDILLKDPSQLSKLPDEALALNWGYEADHPFAEETALFAASKLDFCVCPGTSSWRTFAGRSRNMEENIRSAVEAGLTHGAEGVLLTDWGDQGHLQQNPVSYPALAWCGLLAWNQEDATLEDAAAWCDLAAFSGQSGDCASWLSAGRLHELLERKIHNGSSVFQILENPAEVPGKLDTEKIKQLLQEMDQLTAPQTFREEWDQSLRNMRLCLHIALKQQGLAVPGVKELLQETLKAQETLWRKKNREGGLAESLRMYTEVSRIIQHGELND